MDEENKQDAGLQSDEQPTDLVVDVPADEAGSDQAPNKEAEDPSDKLTPDHPRFKEVLDRAKTAEEKAEALEVELAEVKESIAQRKEATGDDDLTEDERASLAKIQRELDKSGYVKQSDLQVTKNAENLTKLSEKYDGKGDLPKFQPVDVVAYAKKNGFGNNFEAAYREMNFDAIVEVEAKKKSAAPQAPSVEKPTGGGEATTTKRFTREDIKNMSDAEYEKYRTGLLQAVKPKPTS